MPDAPAALRSDLEIAPIEHEGRALFLLQDPESGAESALGLSPAGMAVAALLDGRRGVAEIQKALKDETGATLAAPELERVIAQLERAGLLETEAVRAERARRRESFARSPVRPAVFQGAVYPEGGLELAQFLGGFLSDAKGPGKPLADKPSGPAPLGLVSPHIDFKRGGPSYAWAYQALSECEPPDAIVALGVAHRSPASPWTLTRKAYETPYGPMQVDARLYEAVAAGLWYDPLADEDVHRREHSLEFQALWLRWLWRDKTPPWVPVLCSAFERWADERAPSSVPTVESALRRIGDSLAEAGRGRRILVLAGIDLAHVGPKFGDALEPTPEICGRIEAEDRGSLEKALALDADGFYLSVVAQGHWRKVCGLSAYYTALRWIQALGGGAAPGRLLSYAQAPDPMGGVVSFCGALHPRPA